MLMRNEEGEWLDITPSMMLWDVKRICIAYDNSESYTSREMYSIIIEHNAINNKTPQYLELKIASPLNGETSFNLDKKGKLQTIGTKLKKLIGFLRKENDDGKLCTVQTTAE